MGNVESTGDGSRDLHAAAKRGDSNAINLLQSTGAGLEWRDTKARDMTRRARCAALWLVEMEATSEAGST